VDQARRKLGQERLEPQALFQVDTDRAAGGATIQEQRDEQSLDGDENGRTEEVPRQ
jgi:hypothetical protein